MVIYWSALEQKLTVINKNITEYKIFRLIYRTERTESAHKRGDIASLNGDTEALL